MMVNSGGAEIGIAKGNDGFIRGIAVREREKIC